MKKPRQSKRPPKKKRWTGKRSFKSRLADFGLGVAGLGLAAVSSYFPYYVYTNANEFGPPKMTFTGRIALIDEGSEEPADEIVVSSARQPLFLDEPQASNPIVTGSIRDLAPAPPKNQARIPDASQRIAPVPSTGQQTGLQLVFATQGRALIRDGDDLLPVAVGSRLPDGSTVKSVAKPNDKWRLLTSTNQVLELSN